MPLLMTFERNEDILSSIVSVETSLLEEEVNTVDTRD